jgi:hypothetical protein
MATASNELTDHAEQAEAFYSASPSPFQPPDIELTSFLTAEPSEHGGKKKDGSPDKRVSSDHGKLPPRFI